ncbi:MAG: hypothetical protein WCF84_14070 [Anaerolineae bacterium]
MDEQTIRNRLTRTVQTAQERLTQIEQLNQGLQAEQQQQAALKQYKLQVESIAQGWRDSTTRPESLELLRKKDASLRDVLLLRKAKLENQLQRWNAGAETNPDENQPQILADLEAAHNRLAALDQLEKQLKRLQELSNRRARLSAQLALAQQLSSARQEQEQLEKADPDLLSAYSNLVTLQAQLKQRQHMRQEILDQVNWLSQKLGGKTLDWPRLAFESGDDLYVQIGSLQDSLKQRLEIDANQARALANLVKTRDQELEPLRQELVRLRATDEANQTEFENEQQELIEWSSQMARLGRRVPNASLKTVEKLLEELTPQAQALTWFSEIAQAE